MINLKKSYRVTLRLNEKEYEFFQKRFEKSGLEKKSQFIKKMIINGNIIKVDMTEFQNINRLLSNLANNVNQVAKRANETGSIYEADIEDIKKRIDELWQQQVFIVSTLRKLGL